MIRLVPRLFARLEKCSLECIIPLDVNEFLFVRYMFQFCRNITNILEDFYVFTHVFVSFGLKTALQKSNQRKITKFILPSCT